MSLSKTDEYCTCGSLQWAAETVGIPVEFDKDMNEFLLVHGPEGGHNLFIRHCFFCGGKAPESLRASLFARLTDEERRRLVDLTKSLKTVDDTIAALGEPDEDREAGMTITRPERDGKPEETRAYRTLRYRNLSETANVSVTVYPMGEVAFSFSGKHIGKTQDKPAA
jgi:hypothetical protein